MCDILRSMSYQQQDPILDRRASGDARLRLALDTVTRLLSGWRPGDVDLAGSPLISGWGVAWVQHECPVLLGTVTGHPVVGVGDLPVTMTSPVLWIDEHAGWARTVSRWYRLGERSSVFIADFDSEAAASTFIILARRSLGMGVH
jgi:hypothetical protein